MKLRKSRLILICIVITVVLSNLVSALEITDPENDVDYIIQDPYSIEQVSTKPNLDITKVTYSAEGGVVTLSITVKGEIEDGDSITYYVEYECSDATYQYTYNNGNVNARSSNNNGDINHDASTGHSISPTNTLSVTFDVVGTGRTDGKLYGYAGDDFPPLGVNEYWMDNTEDINDEGSGNGGNNGTPPTPKTPGFETLAVIAALGIAFIFLRRRK